MPSLKHLLHTSSSVSIRDTFETPYAKSHGFNQTVTFNCCKQTGLIPQPVLIIRLLTDCLVIQILRVIRLREEEPALSD